MTPFLTPKNDPFFDPLFGPPKNTPFFDPPGTPPGTPPRDPQKGPKMVKNGQKPKKPKKWPKIPPFLTQKTPDFSLTRSAEILKNTCKYRVLGGTPLFTPIFPSSQPPDFLCRLPGFWNPGTPPKRGHFWPFLAIFGHFWGIFGYFQRGWNGINISAGLEREK